MSVLYLLIIAAVIAVGVWALSGIYIVGPDENGVIRRFGEMVRVTSPGLNYHAPWPFETVDRPKVTQVKRVEIGFRTDPRNPNQYISVPSEALMLTGDENIIDSSSPLGFTNCSRKTYE